MVEVVAELNEIAGKKAMLSPLTGVPNAEISVIVPPLLISTTVIVQSFTGDDPPRDTPGIIN